MIVGRSCSGRSMRAIAPRRCRRRAVVDGRRRGGADVPGAHRPRRRSGQRHFGRCKARHRAEACRSRSEIRHPACRRHRQLARRPGDRALRQRAVPRMEARREGQEQRRAAAGRAERASGPHRGRLWPRGHADRCARQGHHHQCDHAPLQDRRLQRRHLARRRRHHHGAHHRFVRVGEAPRPAAGQSAGAAIRSTGSSF